MKQWMSSGITGRESSFSITQKNQRLIPTGPEQSAESRFLPDHALLHIWVARHATLLGNEPDLHRGGSLEEDLACAYRSLHEIRSMS